MWIVLATSDSGIIAATAASRRSRAWSLDPGGPGRPVICRRGSERGHQPRISITSPEGSQIAYRPASLTAATGVRSVSLIETEEGHEILTSARLHPRQALDACRDGGRVKIDERWGVLEAGGRDDLRAGNDRGTLDRDVAGAEKRRVDKPEAAAGKGDERDGDDDAPAPAPAPEPGDIHPSGLDTRIGHVVGTPRGRGTGKRWSTSSMADRSSEVRDAAPAGCGGSGSAPAL